MRVKLQPSYVLHSRPYRDTSSLLEIFTPEYGRVSVVARGTRRKSRGGAKAASLQVFQPLLLSFSGRGELKTLTSFETVGGAHGLRGERLYSGLYINELLVRLLHRYDAQPGLFAMYGSVLEQLSGEQPVESTLRHFEMGLLSELGYSFDLKHDGNNGEAVKADSYYSYLDDHGLVERGLGVDPGRPAYAGADLLAIADGVIDGPSARTAKRLLRQALASHLGETPLKSRELFSSRLQIRGREESS